MEININLDTKSLDDAINKLKKLKFDTNFDNEVVDNLVDTCYDKCLENLEQSKFPGYTTQFREVKKSITKTQARNGEGSVNIGFPAIMVEFGTGIKGTSTRNETAGKVGFSDEHDGDYGWIYGTDAEASNPYKWQTSDGSWYGWTTGMISRPFAYNSAQYIKQIAREEVMKAIKRKLGE